MKTQQASLIILHHKHNCRILKEMEGSIATYSCGPQETKIWVQVIPATDHLLQNSLQQIGIIIEDMPSVRKVAQKFSSELIQIEGGSLAWDQDTHKGFFEIIKP